MKKKRNGPNQAQGVASKCSSRIAKSGSHAHEFFIGSEKYIVFSQNDLSPVTDGDKVLFEYETRTLKSGYHTKYNAVIPERLIIEAPAELEEKIEGVVYILSNESMPGLLKIGYTKGEATKRADALSRVTSIPTGFRVEWTLPVYGSPRSVEQAAHAHLAANRHGKEFFKVSLDAAKDACISSFVKLYPEQASLMDEAFSIRARNEIKRREHLKKMAEEKEQEVKLNEARKAYEESDEGKWKSHGICSMVVHDFKNEPERREPSFFLKLFGVHFEDFMDFKIKAQQNASEILWYISIAGRKSEQHISEHKYFSSRNDCLEYASELAKSYGILNYKIVVDVANNLIENPPVPLDLPKNYMSARSLIIESMDNLVIRPAPIKPRKYKR